MVVALCITISPFYGSCFGPFANIFRLLLPLRSPDIEKCLCGFHGTYSVRFLVLVTRLFPYPSLPSLFSDLIHNFGIWFVLVWTWYIWPLYWFSDLRPSSSLLFRFSPGFGISKYLTSAQPALGFVSPASYRQYAGTLVFYRDGAGCGGPERKLALGQGTAGTTEWGGPIRTSWRHCFPGIFISAVVVKHSFCQYWME